MKLETTRFGELEVDPQAVLTFPRGLAGFENCTRFQLVHEDKAGPVVFYLQSLDDAAISFSIVDPAVFGLNYELTLSDDEVALLQAESPNDVGVVLIVYKPQQSGAGQSGVAANINGPLLLNLGKKVGMQKVLVGPQYDVTLREV